MDELVLVTGGTGYVAGWCIAELLRRGYPVRTTMRDLGQQQAVADAVAPAVAAPDARLEFARADLTLQEVRTLHGIVHELVTHRKKKGGTAEK